MTADSYPSVTIVAGDIEAPRGPATTSGHHMIRMHDGATYIHINPETPKRTTPETTKKLTKTTTTTIPSDSTR